ncbi:hypothetical protein QTP88_018343 [Uroleucon formosanum]
MMKSNIKFVQPIPNNAESCEVQYIHSSTHLYGSHNISYYYLWDKGRVYLVLECLLEVIPHSYKTISSNNSTYQATDQLQN